MSLRRLIILISTLLGGITIISSIVLIALTSRLNNNAETIGRAVESVRIAKNIQLNLHEFNNALVLYQITKNRAYLEKVDSLLTTINQQIDESRKYSFIPSEIEIISNLEVIFEKYANIQKLQNREQKTRMLILLSRSKELENLMSLAQALSYVNSEQSRALVSASATDDEIANLLGIPALILALFSIPILIYSLQKWLYQPVMNLSESISKFTEKSQTRIPKTDILEFNIIADSFNEMANRLDGQKASQLQFLASVAHDLRNPLGAIQMATSLLSEDETLTGSQKEMADIIRRQTQSLDRMVGDLLDSTRIEAGNLEIVKTNCDLSEIVANSIKLNSNLSQIHQFKVDAASPCQGNFDSVRMSQVMNNLINNAIKYSPNGGLIQVGLSQSSDKIKIEVVDQGIGIAEEDLKQIFEPFKRTKLTKLSIPGVGLGLSVTKKIIEAHAGFVEVFSQPGKGSKFVITFPH